MYLKWLLLCLSKYQWLVGRSTAVANALCYLPRRYLMPNVSERKRLLAALRYTEESIHGICLINWHPSLLATALSACFIGNARGSRGEEVSPASTTYCADILFNGYSFWWRLFYSLPCRSTKFLKGEGDVEFSNPPPWVLSSSVRPCTNLRCDTL